MLGHAFAGIPEFEFYYNVDRCDYSANRATRLSKRGIRCWLFALSLFGHLGIWARGSKGCFRFCFYVEKAGAGIDVSGFAFSTGMRVRGTSICLIKG